MLLVALTMALPGAPAESQAGDRSARTPQKLWRMFPLGPRSHTDYQSRSLHANPPHPGAAVASTDSPRPRSSGGSRSFRPLGWLFAAAAGITAAFAVALHERRAIARLADLVGSPAHMGSRAERWRSPPARAPARAADLGDLSRTELYQLAAECGIDGRSRMSRERLIEALTRYREET